MRRGFTLIELLIVIGIVAVLSTVVILSLQPAELLRQARDGTRLAEARSIDKAIGLAVTQNPGINLGAANTVFVSLPDSNVNCSSYPQLPPLKATWQYHCAPVSTLQSVNSTGWIPVDFASLGIVPLEMLPTDPVNDATRGFYYTYVPGWEIDTKMESVKFVNGGSSNKESTDGGDDPDIFEVGTNLASLPGPGITFNSTSSAVVQNVSNITWPHTIKNGKKKILVVGISTYHAGGSPASDITAITYGGAQLTKINRQPRSGTASDLWYLLNPPVGTSNISISLTIPAYVVAGAISLNGVDQNTPVESKNQAYDLDVFSFGIGVNTLTGGAWVVDNLACEACGDSSVVIPDITQNLNWKRPSDIWVVGGSSYTTSVTPGLVPMSWQMSWGSNNVISVAASIRPAQ